MKHFKLLLLIIVSFLVWACTEKKKEIANTNFNEANKASIIKANDEIFHKGNLSYADEVFAENYAGQGPAYIKKFVGNMRTAFPDIHVSIEPIIAEGNKTAWQRTHTATHQGEFMGFQPTNKKITWKAIIISEYNEEGKVTKEWAVNDLFEVLQKNQENDK